MTEEIVKSIKELLKNDGFEFENSNGYSSEGRLEEFKVKIENKEYRITVQEVEYRG